MDKVKTTVNVGRCANYGNLYRSGMIALSPVYERCIFHGGSVQAILESAQALADVYVWECPLCHHMNTTSVTRSPSSHDDGANQEGEH